MQTDIDQLIAKVKALPPEQLYEIERFIDAKAGIGQPNELFGDDYAFFMQSMYHLMADEDEGYGEL